MTDRRTVYRTCGLCEATCGVAIEVEDDRVVTVRGDKDDPFSKGYICPKAYGLKGLHEDPDRLRHPVRRTEIGWQEISWDQAYALVGERLTAIRDQHGRDAIGIHVGNPPIHTMDAVYIPVLWRALSTKQRYSSASVDALPKRVSGALMFGTANLVPVPDIDRTNYLLILGANPAISNGSVMTAPNMKARLKAIQNRGGKVILIDPRRNETAEIADEHVFIRPGTDAYLLMAMVHTMFAEELIDLGPMEEHIAGLKEVEAAVRDFPPEAVADRCSIPAETIRRLTREFCGAPSAACYGRIGTCTQEFGTLASWAVDLVNTLSGNLDSPGGAMFPRPAASPGRPSAQLGRWQSRVRGLPAVFGEFTVSTLAEEIDTPGEGQIRAMITVAGNPVCSAPNAERLSDALASLDFMVSVDYYINQTTRHADVILPPVGALERDAYELLPYDNLVRNVTKYSPAVFEKPEDTQYEWEILATIAAHLMGFGGMDLKTVDDFIIRQVATEQIDNGSWDGLTPEEALEKLSDEPGPKRVIDLFIRTGLWGDGFGRKPDGLTLEKVRSHGHGLDLGPLQPELPGALRTPDAKVELAPEAILTDVNRLRGALERPRNGLLLIGRRHLRSNNSWMHNVASLVKGPERCTLLINEDDAQRLGLRTGDPAKIASAVGSVVAPVEVTDEMMPGVVSLPHGWGHDAEGVQMPVAAAHPGVNSNILTDHGPVDGPTGTAVLNGIPVTVEPVPAESNAEDGARSAVPAEIA